MNINQVTRGRRVDFVRIKGIRANFGSADFGRITLTDHQSYLTIIAGNSLINRKSAWQLFATGGCDGEKDPHQNQ